MMFAASARVAVTTRVPGRMTASARMPVAETLAAAKVFGRVVTAAEMGAA